MVILESPELTASKTVWTAWLERLKQMHSNDASVRFAIRRAEQVLQRKKERKENS